MSVESIPTPEENETNTTPDDLFELANAVELQQNNQPRAHSTELTDEQVDDEFEKISAEIARKGMDIHPLPRLRVTERGKKAIIATAVLSGMTVTGIAVANASAERYVASDAVEEAFVGEGGSIYGLVAGVENSDKISQNYGAEIISSMPVNIDAMKDGLQPGEKIIVPEKFVKQSELDDN